MSRSLSSVVVLLALPFAAQACIPPWWLFDDDDDGAPYVQYEDDAAPPPTTANEPPDIVDISIANWPPVGPETNIEVDVQDFDGNLSSLELSFREQISLGVTGDGGIVTVNGWQLGEGFGTLTLEASDTEGATATRWVEDMLVDLTPPEITLGDNVLGADTYYEAWVADAWILGKAELEVGTVVLEQDFEDGFPPSLGEAWDYSLVKFPTNLLPEGTTEAKVIATDAAGNSTTMSFTLTIDGTAPTVQIVSPAANTTVSGFFEVQLQANDPGDGPVWIDISVGGTPAATALGPTATVLLDAAELTGGPVLLEATAVDQAGNESALASIPITIQ